MRIPSPLIGRVRPQTTDVAKPINVSGATPEAFGAGIGAAVAGVGAAVANRGDALMQRDTQYERYDALQKYSEFESNVNKGAMEISRTARPDGTDVPDRVKLYVDEEEKKYLDSINPQLREEMKVRTQSVRQNASVGAFNYKNKAQDAAVTQGVMDQLSRAKTFVDQDPEKADEELGKLRESIMASQLPPVEKQRQARVVEVELRKVEMQRRIALGQYNQLNADPTSAIDYVVDRINFNESSGDTAATNSRSSATGLGQFTSDTWLEVLRRNMPELAAGKTDAELLSMRTDGNLSRQMTKAYLTENVRTLREAGFAPTPTNIYLAHFLGPTGALRALSADPAADVRTFLGKQSLDSNPEVFTRVKTAADLKAWAQEKMGTAGALKAPPIEFKQDQNGYWTGGGVEYELNGKIRALPVSREYVERVVPTIKAIDPSLSIRITSAGQEHGKGTGSHRHDVDAKGESATSDFVLMRDGKPIRPGDDKALYAKVLEELAAKGFTGIGHYEWGLHVGGGSKAAWGPSKSSRDLDPDFKRAIERGWARASDRGIDAIDTDLRYTNVPFEDRVIMRQAAQKDVQQLVAAEAQQRQMARAQFINNLQNSIMDGKAGQKEVDAAFQSGMITDYKTRKMLQDQVESQNSELRMVQQGAAKLATPGAVWDPTSKDDKQMLNAMVRTNKGLDRVASGDRDFFSNYIVPMVRQSSDIPTELVGTLMGMVRSSNLTQSLYAVDALAQLQRIDRRAFEQRVPQDLQRDVEYFTTRRGVKPDAELMNEINGGSSFEEMNMKAQLRKEAKDTLSDKVKGQVVEDRLQKAIISKFDGWFSAAPGVSSLGWAAEGMMNEARNIFVDEFVRERDVNKAIEATAKVMAVNWGVSQVGNKKVMMKHPPEKVGYKPHGGDFTWINQAVREELKLTPQDKFELLSDGQTEKEVENFRLSPDAKPPSYMIVTTDKNGRVALKMKDLPDGRQVPYRTYFEPSDDLKTRLRDKEDNAHKIAVLEQEIRETQSYLLFGNEEASTPQAAKEFRAQLELQKAELARLKRGTPIYSPLELAADVAEFERLRALGEQSTLPSMRK